MIGPIVAAALWAVLASLALSLVLGAVVFGVIAFFRPAAATRQALWSLALGAAGIAPVVILAVMLIRGALLPPDDMPMPAAGGHAVTVHVSVPASGAKSAVALQQPALDDARPAGPPPAFALHVPEPPDMTPIVAQIIVLVWALGAIGGLAGLARSLVRVRGLKLRSSPLDGDLATDLPWLTTIKGREIYLRLSYETETPIAVGFRRPVILIPTEMATAAGLTSIEPLVMHEYAHLARFDDWTNLVQRAIERVFWFNPLVWILGRRIALEREVAADEAVVARTHDAKNYASALWRMAQEMRMPEHVVVAPGAMLTRKQISVRIERLLDDAAPAGRRFGAAGFAVTALAFTGVAALAATAPPIMLAQSNDVMASASPSPKPHVIIRNIVTQSAPAAHAAPHTGVHVAPVTVHVAQASPVAVATSKAEGATDAAESDAARSMVTAIATGVLKSVADNGTAVPPVPPVPSVPPVPPVQPVHPVQPVPNVAAVPPAPPAPTAPPFYGDAEAYGRAMAAYGRAMAAHARQMGAVERAKHLGEADATRQLAASARQTQRSHEAAQHEPVTREMLVSCIGCDFSHRDLSGLDLSGLSLTSDDFSHANLSNANFAGATLTGIDLSRADLSNTNFRSAKLTGVDLNHARLDNVNFADAALTGVDLTGASMTNVNTKGIHLLGSTLP